MCFFPPLRFAPVVRRSFPSIPQQNKREREQTVTEFVRGLVSLVRGGGALAWFPGRRSAGRESVVPISKTDESHGEYSLWEYPLVEKRLVKTKGRDRTDLEWVHSGRGRMSD